MARRAIAIAFSVFVFASALPHAASAQILIKLAHLNPQRPSEIPSAAMAAVFEREVEKNSGGTILVELYPDGSVGSEIETMYQVKSGIVQSFIGSIGGLSSLYPLIDIVSMPFAFRSYDIAYSVLDGSFGSYLAADIGTKAGFKVLGFGESGGFFAITNSRRQIRNPSDLKGLKIRSMPLPLHQTILRSLGALPVTLEWAEVPAALKAGIADGQMNPVSLIAMANLQDVQTQMTLTDLLYSPYVWVMDPKFYSSLSTDQRKIVDEAARSAILAGRSLSRRIDVSEKGLSALSKTMRIYAPNAQEMKAFRDATIPAARSFIASRHGKEGELLMERFYAAIAEAEKTQAH